ncbi:hypothetical protein IW261DRAFT_1426558 [Armillaria novae-zelandiae]|uniref:Uncharacterized protein n=1 Tax=Armillaria novae-zelandiae TaxID=153914 RepID=A0AA39TZF5_9AGAR|nr:hypothetical protein IW261DRAFT_1426558 [Armillaria novae-zelandiae]
MTRPRASLSQIKRTENCWQRVLSLILATIQTTSHSERKHTSGVSGLYKSISRSGRTATVSALASERQALECRQDGQSVGTEQLTLEVSVSDGSDGTVDTSTTAQIRRWRASISETMDSAVDQGLESKIALIVELRERRNEARRAAIALWAAKVYAEQDQPV